MLRLSTWQTRSLEPRFPYQQQERTMLIEGLSLRTTSQAVSNQGSWTRISSRNQNSVLLLPLRYQSSNIRIWNNSIRPGRILIKIRLLSSNKNTIYPCLKPISTHQTCSKVQEEDIGASQCVLSRGVPLKRSHYRCTRVQTAAFTEAVIEAVDEQHHMVAPARVESVKALGNTLLGTGKVRTSETSPAIGVRIGVLAGIVTLADAISPLLQSQQHNEQVKCHTVWEICNCMHRV